MSRLLAALVASLALAGAARAQSADKKPPAPANGSVEADPKVQAAIQAAVEKAKEEIRNEVRAELQGAQSAQEFMGAVADQPKLEVLDLDGYFRVRGEMLNKLHLKNDLDAADHHYFPKPLRSGSRLSSANMRLRLEPTINASEAVRVHAQIDVLDNYVLGSNAGTLSDDVGSPYPVPYWSSTRAYLEDDPSADRPLIIPRRVWADVQTPIGLLSFGRMPSHWGLGILANAGTGLDQDYGDTVDRLQFAIPPVGTPVGRLVFVPFYDFDAEGVLNSDPRFGEGYGQPFDAENNDDARSFGVKIARLDNEDEIRRKVEAGKSSVNFGLLYTRRTQQYVHPGWISGGCTDENPCDEAGFRRRGADAHVGSLWARWVGPRFRIEAELVGLTGDVENAFAGEEGTDEQRVTMRQWGGVVQAAYTYNPKFTFGFEIGAASGDSAPGFGNIPTRSAGGEAQLRPNYGSIEGPQWGRPGDNTINNFRFNPAYQVDLMFYRRILGQVTDSYYAKPSVRWTALPGFTIDGSVMYAQAQLAASTPSSRSVAATEDSPLDPANPGERPLAIEADLRATLSPSPAFSGWLDAGVLRPLGGMDASSWAWMIAFGLAARF
ncbi:MAG TPA: TIGR04551 family protein [Anaeromyxobacter sp.]|nr:TIGR04551 family protein [Anaeromyxobacter sp.]